MPRETFAHAAPSQVLRLKDGKGKLLTEGFPDSVGRRYRQYREAGHDDLRVELPDGTSPPEAWFKQWRPEQ